MEVEIFTLCDFAQEAFGKLTIVGTFDHVFSESFPAFHPQCTIVARIRFLQSEGVHHKISIQFLDQNNKAFIPSINGDVEVNMPNDTNSAIFHVVASINQINLQEPSECTVNLNVDGKKVKSIPLFIKLVKQESFVHG